MSLRTGAKGITLADGSFVTGLLGRFLARGEAGPFTLPGALGERSRLLAIDTGDLCDLLFHVPLLRTVRERYPRARIDFLVPEEHESLIVPSGIAHNCLLYKPNQLKAWSPAFYSLLKGLRERTYDLSVVMSFAPHRALESVALATGAPLRLGPSHAGAYPAVNFEIRARDGDTRYRGSRLAAAAPFLGLPSFAAERAWPLPEERVRRTCQLIHFNKPRQDEVLVGVDPALGRAGAGLSAQNLHFVMNQLSSQMPCRTLPLSISDAASAMARFEAGLNVPPLALPCETLFDTILLASLCDLFIAGNTDLFHFAAASGVPTLGLFLAEDAADWVPAEFPNVRVLRVKPGQRVDIETLMEAVEAVRSVR